MRATLLCLGLMLTPTATVRAEPAPDHPRLWVRPADVVRLRSWAVSSNAVYAQGLAQLAISLKGRMDSGALISDDTGCSRCYTPYPVEWAAELFAFMSLVEPDAAARADYQQRARTLLMHVIDQAALGPSADGSPLPYRERQFSTSDRSLFYGEAFPLTVDWIYPVLSAADKAKIRTTFLRWIGENLVATTSGLDHPEPVWVLNDPALYADRKRARNAINNFYNAHMNQIGLMAMSIDAADDVGVPDKYGKTVRDYIENAIGAWLYVHHHMMTSDAAGGIPPEGMAYGPTGLGRTAEFVLALHTAGYGDAARWGEQVRFDTPYWDSVIDAYLHASSPVKVINHPDEAYKGTVHLISDHGDTYKVYLQGATTLLATLGLHAQLTGHTARLNAIRWMELNMPAGGAAKLTERARDWNFIRDCILTFLLFDPTAATPTDPRPTRPTMFFAPGAGKLLARTDWGPAASWFTYKLGWAGIDHQFGDGNSFEFWRKGEWLTKQWSGYGTVVAGSDYKNTLVLENSIQTATGVTFWTTNQKHGSQYLYGPGGDPPAPLVSLAADYVYAQGNGRNLYNNPAGHSTDILDATRSILWIKPDTIVVFDRVESQTAGRYKRFTLMLPASPTLSNRRAVSLVGSGASAQQLVIDTLLPAAITVSVDSQIPNEAGYNETAEYERVKYRLKVEASGGPARTRFLHVLQGLDGGAAPLTPVLIQSTAGTAFQGAEIGTDAVVTPVDAGVAVASTSFAVSSTVTRYFITGLTPAQKYAVSVTSAGATKQVTVAASSAGSYTADAGGVVQASPDSGPPPTPGLALTTSLNGSSFRAGHTLTLSATLTPGATTTPVDAYIVAQLPGGGYMSLTGGGLVAGIVPIARSVTPVNYNAVVASFTVPAGTPAGNYTWLSALASPGTLNLMTPIAQTPFVIVP